MAATCRGCGYHYEYCDCNEPRGGGTWWKADMSVDRDTGLEQTNFYTGTVGQRDQKKKKVHIAVDILGNVVFVRDQDGSVLYDRKHGIGWLPEDLDWSRS